LQATKNYSGLAEITLREGSHEAAQQILFHATAHGTRITRFEVLEPTLEEIFIETVGDEIEA